jgi:hypothetical protein
MCSRFQNRDDGPIDRKNHRCRLFGCLACGWYIEAQHRQNDFAISVVGLGKNITERRIARWPGIAFEERVFWHRFTNLRNNSCKISISIEDKNGNFCIAPTKVRQELLERG